MVAFMGVDDLVLKGIDLCAEAVVLTAKDGVLGDEGFALGSDGVELGLYAYEAFIACVEYFPDLDAHGVTDGDHGFDTGTFLQREGGVEEAGDRVRGNAGAVGYDLMGYAFGGVLFLVDLDYFIAPHD